jgi:hypothetical protein
MKLQKEIRIGEIMETENDCKVWSGGRNKDESIPIVRGASNRWKNHSNVERK